MLSPKPRWGCTREGMPEADPRQATMTVSGERQLLGTHSINSVYAPTPDTVQPAAATKKLSP